MSFLPPLLLLVLSITVIFPGFGGEYLLLDDDDYVTANPFVRAGLSWDGIAWAFFSTHSGHWHPLTWLSLMVDVQFFGESSDASRVINLLLHSCAVGMLFYPMRAIAGSSIVAFLACGLFAIHPLRLESVLWVSERKDVLAFFFFTMVFALYEYAVRNGNVTSRRIAYLCAFLGLLAKPSLVVLPLLLPLIDFIYLEEKVSFSLVRKCGAKMWPYGLMAGAVSIAAWVGQSAGGGLKSTQALPLSERLNNVGIGYLAYIGKLFWPFDLSVFYPLQAHPQAVGIGASVLLGVFSIYCVVGALRGCKRSHRLLIAAWFWFLGGLLPVIGIIQVGWQQYADRWTYIPHLLPIVAISSLLATEIVRFRKCALLCGVLLIILLGVETHHQSHIWLSSKPLFHQALRHTSKNFFIMTNLGVVYEKEGNLSQARELYREALQHNPEYPLALNNLGTLLANEGRYSDSLVYFKRALTSYPNFVPARFHFGLALFRLEERMAAAIEWAKLLEMAPQHKEASEMLTVALEQLVIAGCRPYEHLRAEQPEVISIQKVSDPALFSKLSDIGCMKP